MIARKHLVAQWKLNDDAGTSTVLDTAHVYNGTYKNGSGDLNTNTGSQTGLILHSLDFDGRVAYGGSAEHVDTGNPFQSTFQSSFSISMWVLSTRRAIATSTFIFGVSSLGEENCVWITASATGSYLAQYSSNNNRARWFNGDVIFPDGQATEWVHLVMVVDHTVRAIHGLHLFVNTSLGADPPADMFRGNTTNVVSSEYQSTVNPYLAAEAIWNMGNTNEWCGRFDNVCLFNKALIESEIDFLWNGGDGREDVWPHFPRLTTGIQIPGFTDEYGDRAVRVANPATGYPLLNEIHRFDGRDLKFQQRRITEADKLLVESFYQANKSKSFYWLNEQDDDVYSVSFAHEPYCQLDGANNLWNIRIGFNQAGVV